MEYKDAYLYLFNQLTDLMQRYAVLQEDIIRIQQHAEEIILSAEEGEAGP